MSPHEAPWQEAYPQIARVLISRRRIARRVRELSRQLADCYAGRELTIVAVLTGSLMFVADLIRHLPLAVRLTPVSVRSYRGASTQPARPRVTLHADDDLADRHVVVVDDILDGGGTLGVLMRMVRSMKPASLASCVLLRKRRSDRPDRTRADFVGFDVPDEFVVGYGLDFDDRYRNLPDVCVLRSYAPDARPDEAAGGRP